MFPETLEAKPSESFLENKLLNAVKVIFTVQNFNLNYFVLNLHTQLSKISVKNLEF